MEVIYSGPRSLFAEFQEQLREASGATQFVIVEGILTKNWVTDEIVRYVVEFDLDGVHTELEVLGNLGRWAKSKASSVIVKVHNHDAEGSSDGAA